MTSKTKFFAALMSASTAFAADNKIEIGGSALNVGVVTGEATNLGLLGNADQAIGVVSGDSNVKIGGSLLNVGVVSGAATNLGLLGDACQEVGAIGKKCPH